MAASNDAIESEMRTPEEMAQIAYELCDDGECPFCGWSLEGRQIFVNCDDEEIYCPNCGYVQGIE